MKFGREKCALLIMKSGKRQMTEVIELPNEGKIRTFGEQEIYDYLGILEVDTMRQGEMTERMKKEYHKRMRKLIKTKLHSINGIKRINNWTVPLERYSRPFLKATREEFQQMDQRTKKFMTIHKDLHPRDYDVDRLYLLRKEGGIELASI